jgi:hypothetical protein
MYKCTFFRIYELVPKELHETKPTWKLWTLFDDRALITLDRLRSRYGKMTINDWYFGGEYQLRGFRPFDSGTGAEFSQHKFGRAFDCKFSDISNEEVIQECIDKKYGCFDLITAIETGVSWFHFDIRNNTDKLIIFSK